MNSWIVETKGLKKYYKLGNHVVKALDGVDFRVKEQEFAAITGRWDLFSRIIIWYRI